MSFLTSLNDGAHYADKNELKQPQVCMKILGIKTNSSFQVFVKNIKIFRGLGEPPIIIIFQRYFTHGVSIVNEMFWKSSP